MPPELIELRALTLLIRICALLSSQVCSKIFVYSKDSLFAVYTSRYFGPQILNSQIKRHILTANLPF